MFPFDDGTSTSNAVKLSDKIIDSKFNCEQIEKIEKEAEKNSQQKLLLNETLELEIVYDSKPKISINILPNPSASQDDESKKIGTIENVQKRNPSLKNRQKSNEEKQRNLTSILKKVTSNIENSPVKKKSVNFILPTEQSVQRSSTNLSDKFKASLGVRKKFESIIDAYFAKFQQRLTVKNGLHPLIRKIFIRARSFDIYWEIVRCNIMLSKKGKQDSVSSNGSSNENVAKAKKQISSEEYSKKINRKLADNRALIMQNARKECVEKDCSYAYNYLQRIRKTLLDNSDEELYSQFMQMLTNFNPEIESVPELYYVSNYS